MHTITLTEAQREQLRTLRENGQSRGYVWQTIRSDFGIPRDMLIGVDADGRLYAKDSVPRRYVLADLRTDGPPVYCATHIESDYPTCSVDTRAIPSPDGMGPQTVSKSAERFTVAPADNDALAWHFVSRDTLLALLRGADTSFDQGEPCGTRALALPEGFPALAAPSPDTVVLDAATGDVYFRR